MSRRESWLIPLFCLVGALRVFLYAAAFPFFSNGDEDMHFDLILRHAAGQVPKSFSGLDESVLDFVGIYASPEFLQTPDQFPDKQFPTPLWKQPPEEAGPVIEATKEAWKSEINWELSQPPLYYQSAAIWWKTARALGARGIESLYCLRFLNVALIAAIIWIGFAAARAIARECSTLRLGAPLLLAFMPQDVFYVMSNDVLSPICFGLVFLSILWWLANRPTALWGALCGLATAGTYLTKLSNLPLLAAGVAAILVTMPGKLREFRSSTARALIILLLTAAIPILLWMLWSRANFGDVTGSAGKMSALDWTLKPLPQWLDHPIFSLSGLRTFWSEMLARLWRGELMWHNQELGFPAADNFYVISSLLFLALAMVATFRSRTLAQSHRRGLLFAAIVFVAALSFFFLLSIALDFGRCIFPSRAHPYFTSARLMSGALVPFAILYVFGLINLTRILLPRISPWVVLLAIVAICCGSEIAVKHSVFESEHNWFHLGTDQDRI